MFIPKGFTRRSITALPVALAVAVAGVGCGSKTSSKRDASPAKNNADAQPVTPPAPSNPAFGFLKWSDFDEYKIPESQKTSSSGVLSSLEWEPLLYLNFPKYNEAANTVVQTPQEAAESKCREDRFIQGAKVEVDKDTIKATISVDKKCGSEIEFSRKVVFHYQCLGSDLSSLNGKSLKEVGEAMDKSLEVGGLCANATEIREFQNVSSRSVNKDEYTTKFFEASSMDTTGNISTSSTSKQVVTLTTYTDIEAYMRPDGTPCVFKRKGNKFVQDGECWQQFASRSSSVDSSNLQDKIAPRVERKSFKATGMVRDIGSKSVWLSAGSFEVSINGWLGTVTAAPGSAPRARFKSSSGQTIDQLVPVASFSSEEWDSSVADDAADNEQSDSEWSEESTSGTQESWNANP